MLLNNRCENIELLRSSSCATKDSNITHLVIKCDMKRDNLRCRLNDKGAIGAAAKAARRVILLQLLTVIQALNRRTPRLVELYRAYG